MGMARTCCSSVDDLQRRASPAAVSEVSSVFRQRNFNRFGVGVHSTSRQQLTLSAVTVRRGATGENGMALAINVFEASRRAVAPDPLHNAQVFVADA